MALLCRFRLCLPFYKERTGVLAYRLGKAKKEAFMPDKDRRQTVCVPGAPVQRDVRDKASPRRGYGRWLAALVGVLSLLLLAPAMAQTHQHGATPETVAQTQAEPAAPSAENQPAATDPVSGVSYHNPRTFTLRTGIASGRMVYLGVGGDIDGQVNPTLMVHEGELVQVNLINGEGAEHDVVIDQYAARSSIVVGKNASSTFSFTAGKVGEFAYFCSIAGHRQAGMEGLIQVMAGPRAAMASEGRRRRARSRRPARSDRPAHAAGGQGRSRNGRTGRPAG